MRIESGNDCIASPSNPVTFFRRLGSESGFRRNLIANFTGTAWGAIVQLLSIPVYIKFLGVEAYGLIGFYLMVQSVLQVLDLGLSPTMNREMARYSVQPEKTAEARDFVRTVEGGYWLVGIVLGAAVVIAAPWLADHWITARTLRVDDVRRAVVLMGLLTVCQWPVSFYQGGLMGLGRQVLYNTITISFSTISNAGAILVLWHISPTIRAFFLWFVATNAIKTICLAISLWTSLPQADRPARFDLGRLRSIRSFAAGMSGITVCALILMQSDKIILSKLFNLEIFGYYCVAGTMGSGLSMLVTSVFNTIFPRFSALAAVGDEKLLKDFYHRCTQLMTLLILPLAAVLALFATQILQLWTRNADVARNAGPIAVWLIIGSALNGLMNLPYALQLAYGWVSIALWLAVSMTVITVPALCVMAISYGPIGAASVWAGMNAIYMLVGVPLTHRRVLKGAASQWLMDISLPLLPVLLIVVVGKELMASTMSRPAAIVELVLVLFCAGLAAALASSSIRPWLVSYVWRAKTLY